MTILRFPFDFFCSTRAVAHIAQSLLGIIFDPAFTCLSRIRAGVYNFKAKFFWSSSVKRLPIKVPIKKSFVDTLAVIFDPAAHLVASETTANSKHNLCALR